MATLDLFRMRYLKYYSIHPADALLGLPEDSRFLINDVQVIVRESQEEKNQVKFEASIPVDPRGLKLREGEQPLDGSQPQKGITVPESKLVYPAVQSLTRILSFVFNTPLKSASLLGDELVPECADDEDVLKSLQNLSVFVDLGSEFSIKGPHFNMISTDLIDQLLEREVGLAIYLDSLLISTAIGKYRELWKVVESAFGQKDSELLKSLEQFKPITDLEFDKEELKQIHILRGRASHAESSAGLAEYNAITKEVREKLPRLKSMVEQVLLNKKTWGTRGFAVSQLAELKTYVRKDGMPVLINQENGKNVE